MYTSRITLLVAMIAGILLISGCEKSPDTSTVLATVNGEPITEKNYDHFLSRLKGPIHPDKEKEKEIVLEELTKQMLLAQYALDNKLDQKLDVYLTLQRQREAVLVSAAQRKIFKEAPEITAEQLKARYQKEVEAAPKTEYRVQHIVVETEDEAKTIIRQLNKGQDFAKLAKSKSRGPTKNKGGHLGWLQQGMVVPEFFAAMSSLKKGRYTKVPVKTPFGWHIIKLIDTRAVKIPPFDKVKTSVRRLIQQEILDAEVAKLKEKAKIEIK